MTRWLLLVALIFGFVGCGKGDPAKGKEVKKMEIPAGLPGGPAGKTPDPKMNPNPKN